MSKNSVPKNGELFKGDFLMSNNGQWKAVFQEDSNFVVYGWTPVWASDTWNANAFRVAMQEDCNLVIYNKDNVPKWHTGMTQNGNHRTNLQLTDEGKLVVYKDSDVMWTSDMSKGTKM